MSSVPAGRSGKIDFTSSRERDPERPSALLQMSRERESDPEPEQEQESGPSLEAQVRRLGDDVTIPEVMGRLGLPPSARSRVEQVVEGE